MNSDDAFILMFYLGGMCAVFALAGWIAEWLDKHPEIKTWRLWK